MLHTEIYVAGLEHKIELLEKENEQLKIILKVDLLGALLQLSKDVQQCIDRVKFLEPPE